MRTLPILKMDNKNWQAMPVSITIVLVFCNGMAVRKRTPPTCPFACKERGRRVYPRVMCASKHWCGVALVVAQAGVCREAVSNEFRGRYTTKSPTNKLCDGFFLGGRVRAVRGGVFSVTG